MIASPAAVALCCAALLRRRGEASDLLRFLASGERLRMETLLAELQAADDDELRRRWSEARRQDAVHRLAGAARAEGIDALTASPFVREWLSTRVTG